MSEFDVVVIGGGTAGVASAQSAVEQGVRVALVELNRLGGHSLLKGQLPLKVIRAQLEKQDEPISFERLVQKVEEEASKLSKEIEDGLKSSGVEYLKGEGVLEGSKQVRVGAGDDSSLLKSEKIVIATGSLPKPISKIPFDEQSIFYSDRLLDWKERPNSLLIVGGDKTGLEAAYLFSLLGTKVFLVDENQRLIHDKDPDLIVALEAGFKKQKIKTLLGKKIISIFKDDQKVDITLDGGVKFSTEKILVSGERQGNTANLGLDGLSIETGSDQEIWVNENMETSLKGVYAVGSVTGRSHSLQISKEEGRVAGVNAAGGSESVDQDQISFYLETQPEIVSIGCRSGDAHYKGFRAVEGRYDSNNLGESFHKIVADRESKRFIGAQISGQETAESIALLQSNIREGVPVKNLTDTSDSTPFSKPIISAVKRCIRALSARR